jgi:nicotinate-nucleotide adenylyltransferase
MTRRLGVFGGTFDPVHHGHLDAARAVRSALDIGEILFVPSKDPPHRSVVPHASAFHRFALVGLAISGLDGYRVSDAELLRGGRSYTIDTLGQLHAAGWAPSQLFFILGTDAFAEIATWRQFPGVLDAAHFTVIARPGSTVETALATTPELRGRVRTATEPAGPDATGIFVVRATTRDVSSTMIRERIAGGRPIRDLVPAAVAQHIAAHHLYETEDDLHVQGQDTQRQNVREDR